MAKNQRITNKQLKQIISSIDSTLQEYAKLVSIAEQMNSTVQQTVGLLEKMNELLQLNAPKPDLGTQRLKHYQEQWKIMIKSVGAGLKKLGDRQTYRNIGTTVVTEFEKIRNFIRDFNIKDSIAKLKTNISTTFENLKKQIQSFSWKNLPKNIWTMIQKLYQNIKKGLGPVWRQALKPLFQIQKQATGALTPLKNMVSQAFSPQNLKSAMAFSDNYMNSLARINAVNDGTQSNEELQKKILAAANRSRGRYFEMTEHVAKLGLTAPQAFSSNDEMIAFAELSQKAFRLGGAGAAEQQAGMEQLIRAMGSGGLQGDEFKTILNTAPALADAIAKFTGKSMNDLMAMSAEGAITADIIKGALFTAADDINDKFGGLPMSFGDLWNQISNNAIASFGPVIERVSQFLNSDDGQRLVAGISQAISVAAAMIGSLLDGIAAIASFVTDNWSKIEPILIAVGTIWLGIIIAQLWAMVPPLVAQAAAWLAINWPILLMVALIGLIILAFVRFGKTAEQIVGFIFGAIAWLGAVIWNVIVGVINAIIQFLWARFVEPFIGIIEWFINAFYGGFDNFGDAVKNLFGQIISWALSIVKVFSKLIDSIFGSQITDALQQMQDEVTSWGKNENAITINKDAPTIGERIEYDEAWDAGKQAGTNLVNSVQNAMKGFNLDEMLNFGEEKELGDDFPVPGDSTSTINKINKVNEVGRINDTVDISSEDLKMMRELAEMNAIQNFVSLTPTVNVQTGDIRNGYDVDTIISRIEQSLTEQIASSAQGVYGLG